MFTPRDTAVVDELLVLPGSGQQVAYRLLQEDGAIIVEREVLDKEGVSHRLFFTARSADALERLLTEDESFGDGRRHLAHRLLRAAGPRLPASAPSASTEDAFAALARLSPGASQAAVGAALATLGGHAGLPHFLAVWLRRHGEGRISTRLLAGCDPAWARAMVTRRWCVTDPLLNARARNEAIGNWQIARLSPGQEAAAAQAAKHGLAHLLCVPAHEAGGAATLALLFGGTERPAADRLERDVMPLLQSAALRLLTWARARRWREEHGAVELSDTQRRILTLLAQDFMTQDIAQLLGEPEGRITYHVKRLRALFNAHSGVEVAVRAMEAGLIDPVDRA